MPPGAIRPSNCPSGTMPATSTSCLPPRRNRRAAMPTNERLQWLLDREELFDLVRLERFARDQGDFDRLTASYTPDSRVRVSWFTGTGKAFADASRAVLSSGLVSKHLIVPMRVEIKGD